MHMSKHINQTTVKKKSLGNNAVQTATVSNLIGQLQDLTLINYI